MMLMIVAVLVWPTLVFSADEGTLADRYFFSGNGVIQLHNAKTGAAARVQYRLLDGSYPAEARRQVDALFDVPAGSSDHIATRLVSILDYIEDRYHQPIEIISGYRSPEYNEGLRAQGRLAAKASLHMEGMAADIRMKKVLSAEWFQVLKALNCCGVGFYHDNSLHVDTGPARYWDETTSKVYTNISEHNKQIMARTELDIYRPGETIALRLARITDYPIGVASRFELLRDGAIVKEFSFDNAREGCSVIADPDQRTLQWSIPADIHLDGKIAIRVHLCERAFPEMPEQVLANPIEVRQ
jgi:uncharacterized protein YcbK (DUF882 family)